MLRRFAQLGSLAVLKELQHLQNPSPELPTRGSPSTIRTTYYREDTQRISPTTAGTEKELVDTIDDNENDDSEDTDSDEESESEGERLGCC